MFRIKKGNDFQNLRLYWNYYLFLLGGKKLKLVKAWSPYKSKKENWSRMSNTATATSLS